MRRGSECGGSWFHWPSSRGRSCNASQRAFDGRRVLLGFAVPVLVRAAAEHFEHRMRPLSAGVAVPVFAFFAAGVTVSGWAGLLAAMGDPVTLGVLAGLVVGKPVGVFLTTYLAARFTHARLDDDLAWRDVLGVALLAGIGFTVSLLIGGWRSATRHAGRARTSRS